MIQQDDNLFVTIEPIQPLPSGTLVEVEEWTVDDISNMTATSGPAREKSINKVLRRCRIQEDPDGIYNLDPDSPFPSERGLTGDRSALMILQRIISQGAMFEFDWTCGIIGCQEKVNWEFDLRRLLLPYIITPEGQMLADEAELDPETDNPERMTYVDTDDGPAVIVPRLGEEPILLGDERVYWRQMSPEAVQLWHQSQGETPPYFEDRRGNKVFWRFFTGKEEAQVSAAGGVTNLSALRTASIAKRILHVEVPPKKGDPEAKSTFVRPRAKVSTSKCPITKWVRQWSSRASDRFLQHVNDLEPGLDTTIEVQCPECGEHQDLELPMGAGFFSPSSTRRPSRTRSSSR